MRVCVAADVGSTTTKMLAFAETDGVWRVAADVFAPTTVEPPTADVMVGFAAAAEQVARVLDLAPEEVLGPRRPPWLTLLATSSAGGGLQLAVAGAVSRFSARLAHQAALGAGAVVADVFAADDSRNPVAWLEQLESLRPDLLLLAGGTDEAREIRFIPSFCDVLAQSGVASKAGEDVPLPVVYAGYPRGREAVEAILGGRFLVRAVDNVARDLDRANVEPVRAAILELFTEHVMAHAPGYPQLTRAVDHAVLPTPVACARLLARLADGRERIVAVDVGGATTDVYRSDGSEVHRTVSANLGLSYSALNVLDEAGVAAVARWVDVPLAEGAVRNQVGNKMLRPTTLPTDDVALAVEQGVVREALRLAWAQHQEVYPAPGFQPTVVLGSGGPLSRAPDRLSALAMLVDGLLPTGVAEVVVDSLFLLPHLGVLSEVDQAAALAIWEQVGQVSLATVVAAAGPPAAVSLRPAGGAPVRVPAGQVQIFPWPAGSRVEVAPGSGTDLGSGPGRARTVEVGPGRYGLLVDARGRPAQLPVAQAAWRAS